MFDKIKFAEIIEKISETYNNQRDFSILSGINRTYLSQYKNRKLDEPPKPKILKKLANASNGKTSYEELMTICGYINNTTSSDIRDSLIELYEKQNILEEQRNNRENNLSIEEKKISRDLFSQILNCLHNEHITPENFNPDEILKDMDFISNDTKNKLFEDLAETFNYFYELRKIKKQISDIKWKNSDCYVKFLERQANNKEKQIVNSSTIYACPVYGRISAGLPNWAEECIEGRLPIDPNLMGILDPEECYFLRVNGESMNKIIRNGAYALIRKTDWVENGEIAVVLVNGFDATLKKFSKQGDFVVLEPMSTDSSFKVQIYDKNTSIQVIGKYIGKFEMSK